MTFNQWKSLRSKIIATASWSKNQTFTTSDITLLELTVSVLI